MLHRRFSFGRGWACPQAQARRSELGDLVGAGPGFQAHPSSLIRFRGKTDVDQGVIANLSFGNVSQAESFAMATPSKSILPILQTIDGDIFEKFYRGCQDT